MNKYEELTTYKSNVKGSNAVHILGSIGLVNSIIAIWMWFGFNLNDYANSYYWATILITMITTGSLWLPMTVVWPVY